MVELGTNLDELNTKLQKAQIRLSGAERIAAIIESPDFSAPGNSIPEPLRLDVEDDFRFLENYDRVLRVKFTLIKRAIPEATGEIAALEIQIAQARAAAVMPKVMEFITKEERAEDGEKEKPIPSLEIDLEKREVRIQYNGFERVVNIPDDIKWKIFRFFERNPGKEITPYNPDLRNILESHGITVPYTRHKTIMSAITSLIENLNIEGLEPIISAKPVGEPEGKLVAYTFNTKVITHKIEVEQSVQPETDPSEEEDEQPATFEKIFILAENVTNRLPGKQRELVEIVNIITKDEDMRTWTGEQKEEYIIKSLYAYELESGFKPFNEAKKDFLEILRDLNSKLKDIKVSLSREIKFESDTDNENLVEIKPINVSEEVLEPEKTLEVEVTTASPAEIEIGVLPIEPATPGRREIARRERFDQAVLIMRGIVDILIAEHSGFFEGMSMQVFRNKARENFNRNFTDTIINSTINGKIIRPKKPFGKEAPVITFEEQATLVYIALHGMGFVNRDGKGFIMNVASEAIRLCRLEKEKQSGGTNGQARK